MLAHVARALANTHTACAAAPTQTRNAACGQHRRHNEGEVTDSPNSSVPCKRLFRHLRVYRRGSYGQLFKKPLNTLKTQSTAVSNLSNDAKKAFKHQNGHLIFLTIWPDFRLRVTLNQVTDLLKRKTNTAIVISIITNL